MADTVGERLEVLRKLLGYGPGRGKEWYALLGVGHSTYGLWRKNKSQPTGGALAWLARAGVNINWLLTGEGEPVVKDEPAGGSSVAKDERRQPGGGQALTANGQGASGYDAGGAGVGGYVVV